MSVALLKKFFDLAKLEDKKCSICLDNVDTYNEAYITFKFEKDRNAIKVAKIINNEYKVSLYLPVFIWFIIYNWLCTVYIMPLLINQYKFSGKDLEIYKEKLKPAVFFTGKASIHFLL